MSKGLRIYRNPYEGIEDGEEPLADAFTEFTGTLPCDQPAWWQIFKEGVSFGRAQTEEEQEELNK